MILEKYGIGSYASVNDQRECSETPDFRCPSENRNISEKRNTDVLANTEKPVFR